MRDSNMLHAICQDTYPPIFYLNETSHALINFVTQFNHVSKEIKLAYTFDAGIVSNFKSRDLAWKIFETINSCGKL